MQEYEDDFTDRNTLRVVAFLQTRGRSTVEEVSAATGVNPRRVYDILNSLASTPLVTKVKGRGTHFVFGDGTPYAEAEDVGGLLLNIEVEQRRLLQLLGQVRRRARPAS